MNANKLIVLPVSKNTFRVKVREALRKSNTQMSDARVDEFADRYWHNYRVGLGRKNLTT